MRIVVFITFYIVYVYIVVHCPQVARMHDKSAQQMTFSVIYHFINHLLQLWCHIALQTLVLGVKMTN